MSQITVGQLSEIDLKLLGTLADKKVLELGSHAAVAFARAGAHVVAVDSSATRLDEARRLATEHEVKIELQEGDLADLARIRPESIDAAYSCFALQYVEDLGRLFRQVHRALKPEAPIVFSMPHPWATIVDSSDPQRPTITGSYFAKAATGATETDGPPMYRHSITSVHTDLVRSNFHVDALVEPEPANHAVRLFPNTLVVRARKVGL